MVVPINTRKQSYPARRWVKPVVITLGAMTLAVAGVAGWQWQVWHSKALLFDYSKLGEMESASQIFDRNGELLGRIFIQNRDQKPLSELSSFLQKAVVSAEDSRFYGHSGVDFYGIARAMTRNFQAGKARQGASTLSQQLARNTFPKDLPSDDRSIRRKVLEMFVAWEVENHLTKLQILEHYLNRVFFGAGFYGAESAAQGYFGKRARDLSLSESALLAGLLRSPNNLSPWRNRKACLESRNYVLFRMRELNVITDAQYREAIAEEPMVKNRRATLLESYAADMVSAHMSKFVGRENTLSDGYRIYTSIDLKLQRKAESALQAQLSQVEQRSDFQKHQTYAQFDGIYRAWKRAQSTGGEEPTPKPEYLQGSVIILDNATGAIRAIVGGRDPQHSEFNRVTQAKRPAGSAFLPLVYATAFEKGLHPGTIVYDTVMDNRMVMVGGTSGILGEWAREQANTPYEGPVTARTALVKSKNAATVRFGMQIGDDLKESLESVGALAKAAGIESALRAFPATFLGSSEVTPMELVLAYTSIAGGGSRPNAPFLVDRVEEKGGNVIYRAEPSRTKAFSVGPAYQVHDCLTAALSEGTGAGAFTSMGLKRMPLAGKTGTAYNFTDAWFVGYSSEITCGVWVGFDKPRTPIFYGAFGSDIALPVWTEVMNASFGSYPPRDFTRPESLHACQICSKSGYNLLPRCQEPGQGGQPVSTATEIWLTEFQRPGQDEPCDVHGPKRPRVRHNSGSTVLAKAQLTIDPSTITPIPLQSPTVLGDDPFQSLQAEQTAKALKNYKDRGTAAPLDNKIPALEQPEPQLPDIPRAEPVRPGESQPAIPKAEPVKNLPKLEF